MTWSFSDVDYKIYQRNPLVSSDIEIKFHPIVRITQQADVALFQDKIRQIFPLYNQHNVRGVTVDPQGNFSVQDNVDHLFTDIQNKNSIILNQESLRVSSQDHQNRAQLIRQFTSGVDALQSVFGFVNPYRLGVRYVNIIGKDVIAKDLGEKQLQWKDLISEEFMSIPKEIAVISNTNTMTEIKSNLISAEGELGLRYGVTQNKDEVPEHFRFDIDRYIHLQNGIDIDKTDEYINIFTQDIYSLFNTVIGSKLKQWMEQDSGEMQNG